MDNTLLQKYRILYSSKKLRTVVDFLLAINCGVNNRTVEQLPLTATRPPLGCRAFIVCTHLRWIINFAQLNFVSR